MPDEEGWRIHKGGDPLMMMQVTVLANLEHSGTKRVRFKMERIGMVGVGLGLNFE